MRAAAAPLVKAANWLNHLEYEWESPVWKHWIEEISRRHLFVRYDERGCGLSDWQLQDLSFEAWVHDLETVVDALGLDRFVFWESHRAERWQPPTPRGIPRGSIG